MADTPTLADAASSGSLFGPHPTPIADAVRGMFGGGAIAVPVPQAFPTPPATTGVGIAPTTTAGAAAARGGIYPTNAAVDPQFVRVVQPQVPIDHSHPDNPGAVSAQEMARQNLGKITPYQMAQERAAYAPLVSPNQQITQSIVNAEQADYAAQQRAVDLHPGSILGADGKTPMSPHDIFVAHQARMLSIIQANQMLNMNAAALAGGGMPNPNGQ